MTNYVILNVLNIQALSYYYQPQPTTQSISQPSNVQPQNKTIMSTAHHPTTGGPDLSLHDQDLVDVMAELERCEDDPRADFVFKQAESGQILPLSEEEFRPLRAVKGGPFGK
jgi:hypothetical protein